MIVLGIDTATRVSSVALGSREGVLGSRMLAQGRGHVEFLMPAIVDLCRETGVHLDRLAGIAVDVGPGLFTGMRVGIATAKAMAQTLSVPLVGLASLDLLAFGVRYSPKLICPCIDAKRGEVFTAFYRAVPGGVERETPYASLAPGDLAAEIVARRDHVLLVGDGAISYAEAFEGIDEVEVAAPVRRFPTADLLVELSIPRLEREDFETPERLEPLYVRRSDAEIKWEQRGVVIERPDRVKIPKGAREAG